MTVEKWESRGFGKCTKYSLRTAFKHIDLDILDFITVLKEISFILNSKPVELLLGTYSKDGGAQELVSSLSKTWTCITCSYEMEEWELIGNKLHLNWTTETCKDRRKDQAMASHMD